MKVLNDFKAWIDKSRLQVLPKSKLGEALAYAQKYWDKVTRYVENGSWPIDNNTAENAIRPSWGSHQVDYLNLTCPRSVDHISLMEI